MLEAGQLNQRQAHKILELGLLDQGSLSFALDQLGHQAGQLDLCQFLVQQGMLAPDIATTIRHVAHHAQPMGAHRASPSGRSPGLSRLLVNSEPDPDFQEVLDSFRRSRGAQPLDLDASLRFESQTERPTGRYRASGRLPISGHELDVPQDFVLGPELGRGGMGVVYLAQQTSLRREVAVKTLKTDKVSQRARDNFLREAFVTAWLDHPNIVPIYQLSLNNDQQYQLAMKKIGGSSWETKLQNSSDRDEHLQILIKVCQAIALAHSRGIIHADLKPENVMIGEFGEVYVMDWGLAINLNDDQAELMIARPRSKIRGPIGTPRYMAPEQFEGKASKFGKWTDVFQLGGLLYQLLTGHEPNQGESIQQVMTTAYGIEPRPFPAGLPTELKSLVETALSADPRDRFPDASSFQKALENYLQHEESVIISDKAWERLEHRQVMQLSFHSNSGDEFQGEYADFTEVVASFRQALELWPGNERARAGEIQARRELAQVAIKNDDLGLAESQLRRLSEPSEDDQALLLSVQQRALSKSQRERSLRALRWSFGLTVLALVLFLSGTLWVVWQSKQAEAQLRARAEAQERQAKANEELAHKNAKLARQAGELAAARLKDTRKLLSAWMLQEGKAAFRERSYTKAQSFYTSSLIYRDKTNIREALLSIECLSQSWYLERSLSLSNQLKERPSVLKMRFDPKGEGLVLATGSSTLLQWTGANNIRRIHLAPTINFGLKHIAWSPEGASLAIAGDSPRIYVLNIGKRSCVPLEGHQGHVLALAYHPSSPVLASSAHDQTIRLWDTQRQVLLRTFSGLPAKVTQLAWHSDGKALLLVYADKSMQLLKLETGGCEAVPGARNGVVLDGFAYKRGPYFLSCGDKQLWVSYIHRKPLLSLFETPVDVECATWSPSGRFVAASGKSGSVQLYSLATGKKMLELLGPEANLEALAWSPKGDCLLALDSKFKLHVWRRRRQPLCQNYGSHSGLISALAWHPKSSELILAGQEYVEIWDTQADRLLRQISVPKAWITALDCSSDGQSLAFGVNGQAVLIADLKSQQFTFKKALPVPATYRFPVGQGNAFLADVKTDSDPCEWYTIAKDLKHKLSKGRRKGFVTDSGQVHIRKNPAQIQCVRFSPDGQRLASASLGVIHIWDCQSGQLLTTLKGQGHCFETIVWHPKGDRLAACSASGQVYLWDALTYKLQDIFNMHGETVFGLAWAGQGQQLMSIGFDNELKLWNPDQGKIERSLKAPPSTRFLATSPDGEWVALGGLDVVQVLNRDWQPQFSIPIHRGPLRALAFDPSGQKLAASFADYSVRVWSLPEVFKELKKSPKDLVKALEKKSRSSLAKLDPMLKSLDSEKQGD